MVQIDIWLHHSESFLRKHNIYSSMTLHNSTNIWVFFFFDLSSEEGPFYLGCSPVKLHCMKIDAGHSETIADVPLEQEDNVWNLENFGVRHPKFAEKRKI